jgi:hypothetical protein
MAFQNIDDFEYITDITEKDRVVAEWFAAHIVD